ncbi:hypothetical protein [Dawidia soli]|uniref:Uncharacterized protein n=1 Tax=Dawidia soli TaxID=2782352 RepID=A0AAP2GK62_9BACT|nr:hypothetical protein [Dawidia soli]MBT1690111.1 hypothetical protein [Dawidia soli]
MAVVFKGFSIEVLNFGYTVNVQDAFRNHVAGAKVVITDLGDFLEEGFTDKQGCYYGNAEEGITHSMVVSKDDFFTYTHRFRILPVSALTFPLKNFPVLVYNASNAPVSAAQVTIASPSHNNAGTTNASGLYEGTIHADRENTVSISKSGFTTYQQVISPYIKITCAQSNVVAVPVVILQ